MTAQSAVPAAFTHPDKVSGGLPEVTLEQACLLPAQTGDVKQVHPNPVRTPCDFSLCFLYCTEQKKADSTICTALG